MSFGLIVAWPIAVGVGIAGDDVSGEVVGAAYLSHLARAHPRAAVTDAVCCGQLTAGLAFEGAFPRGVPLRKRLAENAGYCVLSIQSNIRPLYS